MNFIGGATTGTAADSISTVSSAGFPIITNFSITEVSAVPLPALALLLLGGIGGLAALRRRRRVV